MSPVIIKLMLSPSPPIAAPAPALTPAPCLTPNIQSSLFHRYSSSQTFFYSNLTSQLVAQRCTRAGLHYQDMVDWTDLQQFMKRQYAISEYRRKMEAFREYYYYHEDCPRVFGVRDLARVYERWHEKRRDLVYKKLKIMFDQSYDTYASSGRSAEDEYGAEEVGNFLLNISQYNPYSKNYYLRVKARQQKNKQAEQQRRKMQQLRSRNETSHYNKLREQLSYMVNNMSGDVSSLMFSAVNGSEFYGSNGIGQKDEAYDKVLDGISLSFRLDTDNQENEVRTIVEYGNSDFRKNKQNRLKQPKLFIGKITDNNSNKIGSAERKIKIDKLREIKILRNENNYKSQPKLITTKINTIGTNSTLEQAKKVSSSINLITVKGFSNKQQIKMVNNKIGLIKYGSLNEPFNNQIMSYSPKKSLRELKVTKLQPPTQVKPKQAQKIPEELQQTKKLTHTTNMYSYPSKQLKRSTQPFRQGAEPTKSNKISYSNPKVITKQVTQYSGNAEQFTDRKIVPGIMASYQSQRLLPSYSESNLTRALDRNTGKKQSLLADKLIGIKLNPEGVIRNGTLHENTARNKSVKIRMKVPGRDALIFNNKLN